MSAPKLKLRFLWSYWPHWTARIFLGCVFLWAGAAKIIDPRAFARTISAYDLVPDLLLVPLAIGLPVVEILVGLAILLNVRWGLQLVSGLLALFLALLAYGIKKGLNVDCGCFSAQELGAQDGLRLAFLRDLGLMAIVAYLFIWQRFHKGSGRKGEARI
jgi:uncharacterized membrane protein YphA (DoxX/SURF4 family)